MSFGNKTSKIFSNIEHLHVAFEGSAKRYPNKIAIVQNNIQITGRNLVPIIIDQLSY